MAEDERGADVEEIVRSATGSSEARVWMGRGEVEHAQSRMKYAVINAT